MKITRHIVLMLGTATVFAAAPSFPDHALDEPSIAKAKSSAEALPAYVAAVPKPIDLVKAVTATGTLNATLDVDVGSQLSGQIAKLFVDFNDKVVKGQPLAELDQRTYIAEVNKSRAALESAKADVKVMEARLDRAKIDLESAILQKTVMAQRVDIAAVHFRIAREDAARKVMLKVRGAAPAVEVADFEAKRDAAAATLRGAQASLAQQDAMIDGARVDVTRAEAELESARASVTRLAAALESAKVDLNRTLIRSPINGVIVGRLVNQGQTVATSLESHTLFSLAGDLHNMDVYAHVDESDIGKIEAGQHATFTVDAFPGRHFTAVVRQIRKAPQVLQNVVTYTVVLTSPNPDGILLPGMTTLTKIAVSRSKDGLKIPVAALNFAPGSAEAAATQPTDTGKVPIWIVGDDGRPKQILVTIAADDGRQLTVLSDDLHASDRVIIGALEKNGKPPDFLRMLAGF